MRLLGRNAECEFLDAALADVLDGRSRVAVLRGEAGVGKSALLSFAIERAADCRVATAVGVESEMELAYSALHQVCAPMLDQLERLPDPQHQALSTVFGLSAGSPPERFLVGLATLTLLAEVAEQQPLVLVVDDAHWLDRASEQILGFVARRLLAERIAILCAARTGIGDRILADLPEVSVGGLAARDARALLLASLPGPLDAAVCDQIVAESHGNPLALLELPRSGDLAGGFALPLRQPVAGKIEQSYVRRLKVLSPDTRLLVLAAAAEPHGDPALLHRATEKLGMDMSAAAPAVQAELITIGTRVEFAHPLVRSAAYHSAPIDERQQVHRALAYATDGERDPDRRAWHRACAAPGPDEGVAAELELSAVRAQARGGLAAAAAFLERAATLSVGADQRGRRALEAAEAKHLAGASEAALTLLAMAEEAGLDEVEHAVAQRLRGEIAVEQLRFADAVPLLLDAATRFRSTKAELACETYLEALRAASLAGQRAPNMVRHAAEAARDAPFAAASLRTVDLLLEAFVGVITDGYAVGAPLLKQALDAVRSQDGNSHQSLRWLPLAHRVASDLFDDKMVHAIATQCVQMAREEGALGLLPRALTVLAALHCFEGDLRAANAAVEESDAIADAAGLPRAPFVKAVVAGFRGDEPALSDLVGDRGATSDAPTAGITLSFNDYARAVLYNALGRFEDALSAAERASTETTNAASGWSMVELVEAASRSGRRDLAVQALERLTERTQAGGAEWGLGIEARARALTSPTESAEELYREAIDRLGRSLFATEEARAHLLYGEWLRREGRRVEAREQLRTAHDMFAAMGVDAFAERAGRELIATGEKLRRRTDVQRDDLTPQEEQIARLARSGLSNREIGAQLFLSSRTIEWHLRHVYSKLGISSRNQLQKALPDQTRGRLS